MGTIQEYSISNQTLWDEKVLSFSNYDVFYLSSYLKAFMQESPKNGVPVLLYYENEQDRAINVIFRRDIAKDEKFIGKIDENKFFDLITPYGYGGFYGDITNWDELNRTYLEYCIEKHYICEFVRFNLFSCFHNHFGGDVEKCSHNVIRSLSISPDDMWMDFKQKVRKNIKKASTFNLDIIIEPTLTHIDDFLRIYYSTMDRVNANKEYFFSRKFCEILCEMKENVMFFYVLHDGTVISTELVLFDTNNCYSFIGGTDKNYFNMRPNEFLKYEIIKWAQKKNLKNFVLGGGYGKDDGIYQYKLSFAPHGQRDFYIGKRIYDLRTYNYLVSLRGDDDLNEHFFPLYRS